MLPIWLHQSAEEQRLRASDAEFDRVVSMGMGPRDTGTEEQEVGPCPTTLWNLGDAGVRSCCSCQHATVAPTVACLVHCARQRRACFKIKHRAAAFLNGPRRSLRCRPLPPPFSLPCFLLPICPQFLRSAAEWRRWEAVGAEPWREHKRQLWAEELFESQQRRRLEREQLRCAHPGCCASW